MTKVRTLRFFSIFGILASPFIAMVVILAGLLTPGYNQITDTISSLCDQGSDASQLMIIGFIVFGVLITGFAYALFLNLKRGIKAYAAWFMITLYGVSMMLAGIFQDSPGDLNTEGIIHNAAIITSCLAILFGMWLFAGSVYKRPSWMGFTWFTIIASVLGLILSIIFAVQSYVPFAGLLQRIFYCIILAWIEIVSIWLFRLSFKYSTEHK